VLRHGDRKKTFWGGLDKIREMKFNLVPVVNQLQLGKQRRRFGSAVF
jgi:hypothetical protein